MIFNLLKYLSKRLGKGDNYTFDCGDKDLTDFFHTDAIPHQREMISITYFFYDELMKSAIAFFTVLNDAVRTDPFKTELPPGKEYSFYPAVKIGRFGVDKKYQHEGIGSQMMEFIKRLFIYESKSGCRFLTVDAYNKPEILNFYLKCNFTFYTEKDKNRQTRTMKFDLKPFSDQLNADF
jgi:GNAT superfamily N-acetyltransferase